LHLELFEQPPRHFFNGLLVGILQDRRNGKAMLDGKWVRENLEEAKRRLATRGEEASLNAFQELDTKRRKLLREVEADKELRNRVSDEIGTMKKEGMDTAARIEAMREVSGRIKEMERGLAAVEEELEAVLYRIPNLPHPSVPLGTGPEDNPEIRQWGAPPIFSFSPRNHWDVGEDLGILDFARAAKIAGARFALYKGLGALLERALIGFMLDLHTRKHGYQEVLPPFMAHRRSFLGTGNLPKFEEELFRVADTDYYLVPTAEVPVTNIHQNEILLEDDLPIRYVAYTPCFRKEAGSHGKDTRGLIRLHQFNKVELVKFVRPEDSYDELETLTRDAEEVLRQLGIHYRVVVLCTGDMGFSAAKTYDIEVWLPGQGLYREISSCSNFEDFQARRAAIRYRPGGKGKARFVHTLNGSGLAVGRTVVAILENGQLEDGSVLVPEALRPYMHGVESIRR
jgi:seryl-tRNA synthetase